MMSYWEVYQDLRFKPVRFIPRLFMQLGICMSTMKRIYNGSKTEPF